MTSTVAKSSTFDGSVLGQFRQSVLGERNTLQVSTKVVIIEHYRTVLRPVTGGSGEPFPNVLTRAALEMQQLLDLLMTYNPADFENGYLYGFGFTLGDLGNANDQIQPVAPESFGRSFISPTAFPNVSYNFRFRSRLSCFTNSYTVVPGDIKSFISASRVIIGTWPDTMCRFAGSTDDSGVDTIEECGRVPTVNEVPMPAPFPIPSVAGGGITTRKFVELFPASRQVTEVSQETPQLFIAPPCCMF